MKICKTCNIEYDDSVKFCNNCGEKLEELPEVQENAVIEEIEEEGTVLLDEQFEQPEAEESVVEEPAAEEPIVEEPVVEETVVEEPAAEEVAEEPEQKVEVIKLVPDAPAEAAIAAVSEKAEQKVEKLRQKAAKKAEKIAKKAEKKAEIKDDAAKASKPKGKITFLGVVAAIFLCVFLIVNVGIVFVSSVGAGICASDIRTAEIVVDGQTYSIEAFLDMTSFLEDEQMVSLLESIAYTGAEAEIVVDGETYSVAFAEETADMIRQTLEESRSLKDNIAEAIEEVKEISFFVFIGVLGYAALVSLVCAGASIMALAKRRGAFLVPAIILLLLGISFLALSLICTFAPAVLGICGIEVLFTLKAVPLFAYISSAAILLVGIIFFAVGVKGKKA